MSGVHGVIKDAVEETENIVCDKVADDENEWPREPDILDVAMISFRNSLGCPFGAKCT